MNLASTDPKIQALITKELQRQTDGLELIPSENYVSPAVREAMGSILTNKYSEGYPNKRYYAGNTYVDNIENIAINRAKKIFNTPHANVQPYSGSPANFAVYMATCSPGDTIMGLNLPDGGHLTHGWKVSATAQFYKSYPYHVNSSGEIDIDELWRLAKKHKPKLIWAGATAYERQFDFATFAEIADSVGAYFAADIAHIVGLIIAGVHTNPFKHAHIVTSTTHKTLRGPRGGMIMVTHQGLKKDPELSQKIDRAVFPGLQGGPHDHTTAAIAVALKEAGTKEFKQYGKNIVTNAKTLAKQLTTLDIKLVGGGTENHLMRIDLTPQCGIGGGVFVEHALEVSGITVNKNTIPQDPSVPFYPSGIRLGTPAITTRGMGESEMKKIGIWINEVIREVSEFRLPEVKTERKSYVDSSKEKIEEYLKLKKIASEVREMCQKFPLP